MNTENILIATLKEIKDISSKLETQKNLKIKKYMALENYIMKMIINVYELKDNRNTEIIEDEYSIKLLKFILNKIQVFKNQHNYHFNHTTMILYNTCMKYSYCEQYMVKPEFYKPLTIKF